ncbi:hypothetical protein [Psychrobacter lutiphocae]|uniref:hypothetical protein n=1 Tax=Psychrobacter lutiphocae TaxID=540500 RepID=UPI0012EA7C0A|nr:hypothetical protein [Psychrobacter lutiphocae]
MKKLFVLCMLSGLMQPVLMQPVLAGTQDAHIININDAEMPQCIDSELPYEGFLMNADDVNKSSSIEGVSLVTMQDITALLAKDKNTCERVVAKLVQTANK